MLNRELNSSWRTEVIDTPARVTRLIRETADRVYFAPSTVFGLYLPSNILNQMQLDKENRCR